MIDDPGPLVGTDDGGDHPLAQIMAGLILRPPSPFLRLALDLAHADRHLRGAQIADLHRVQYRLDETGNGHGQLSFRACAAASATL